MMIYRRADVLRGQVDVTDGTQYSPGDWTRRAKGAEQRCPDRATATPERIALGRPSSIECDGDGAASR